MILPDCSRTDDFLGKRGTMYHMIRNIMAVLFVFAFLMACTNNSDTVALRQTAYSSDSKQIYYLDTDNYRWVVDSRWGMDKYDYDTISPSGEYLAFVRFPYIALVIKNFKGSILVNEEMQSGDSVDNIAWHPKETHLVFLLRRKGAKTEDSGDVCIVDLQTRKIACIYKDASWMDYVSPPSWSDKGDKLYFVGTAQRIVEYNVLTKICKDVGTVKSREVHYLSDTELVIRGEGRKYYSFNLETKELRYLFKLGYWEYPPISLSPDKKVFFTWDTMPRKLKLGSQWYTLIREFPTGMKLRTISNQGANWFSWTDGKRKKGQAVDNGQ
jgi:Tol biopolymer transport system component